MYTRLIDGHTPLKNDKAVLALIAQVKLEPPGLAGGARFIALLGAEDKLCRVIRTDSDLEFAGITRGLVGLDFRATPIKVVHAVQFDRVYRVDLQL
ncbi:MAG: hypothetical protein V4792_19420 [Pseudomonadota bacterium]